LKIKNPNKKFQLIFLNCGIEEGERGDTFSPGGRDIRGPGGGGV